MERLHEVWVWQNRKGTAYRKEHRPSSVVRRHKCYRYAKGFTEIQPTVYLEEILVLLVIILRGLYLVFQCYVIIVVERITSVEQMKRLRPVSYTHLTLPTKLEV